MKGFLNDLGRVAGVFVMLLALPTLVVVLIALPLFGLAALSPWALLAMIPWLLIVTTALVRYCEKRWP